MEKKAIIKFYDDERIEIIAIDEDTQMFTDVCILLDKKLREARESGKKETLNNILKNIEKLAN